MWLTKLKQIYFKIYCFFQQYGLVVAYLLFSLMILLALTGCKTVEVEKEVVKVDTLYVNHSDTLKIIDIKRDTIRTVDSVYQFIWQKGDTVVIKERIINNNYNSTNNNYEREKVKNDTIYQTKEVEKIVKEEVQPSAWDKFINRLQGALLTLLFLILTIFGLWLWRKFKK